MDIKYLTELVKQRLTLREISEQTKKSPTTIRYWLKKYELELYRGPAGKLPDDVTFLTFQCSCGENSPEKFYGRKRNICGKCHNEYTKEYGKNKKLRLANT